KSQMRNEMSGLIRCLSDIGITGVPSSRALIITSLVGSQMSHARWPFALSQLISRQVRYSCPPQLPLLSRWSKFTRVYRSFRQFEQLLRVFREYNRESY